MTKRYLDLPLIGVLAGLSSVASAQEAPPPASSTGCGPAQCAPALAADARVAIWATEDPDIGAPELSVSAPGYAAFEPGGVTAPVRFFVRSNYSAFIQRLELSIYRGDDADLVQPVATMDLPVAPVSQADWSGPLSGSAPFRPGDELVYVVRAYGASGAVDETEPRSLRLVTPIEAERGGELLRDSGSRAAGVALSPGEARDRALLDQAFGSNALRIQNIPVHGSRIRIQGRDLPEGRRLLINGQPYPVDHERKFVAEYLMPVGDHVFEVVLDGEDGEAPIRRVLRASASNRYFFGVGIADFTLFENSGAGPGSALGPGGDDDDILTDGRLAFYMKAKTGGRYLITAQADTQERPLGDLFDGFTRADPHDVFRRLDPDLYYPTYGDDSATRRDVDTMGRFYVRVDWDKNQALWGNYNTGFTGTEYGQYVRSLYGAALDWRSIPANRWGDPVTELRAFGSEARTAPGHSEFLGTGGSLYYLRHTDILPGSEQVVVEVRDHATGRVEQRVTLARGVDYEMDDLQGRIILTRPLAQITRDNVGGLTRDTPLDGHQQRLIVDYEWIPSGFEADAITAGIRGKHWFGDHIGLGLTYVDEGRSGEDYSLLSGDLTLRAGQGTWLTVEHSRTEATSAPIFFSDNGGLNFSLVNQLGPREGEATAAEARINLKELGWTDLEWTGGAWWRQVDGGYSVSRYDPGENVEEYGVEILGRISPAVSVRGLFSRAERGADALTQAEASAEWRIGDFDALAGEVRRVEERNGALDAAGVLGALRYTRRFGEGLDLYGVAQATLDDDGGAYAANDALTLGGRYNFADASSIGGELVSGDRGDAAQLNGEYRVSPDQSLYGSWTESTADGEYDPLFNTAARDGWTFGQRRRMSDRLSLYNESQFLKTPAGSGLAHTFGLDFFPTTGWSFGLTFSDGELSNEAGDRTDRHAISLSGGVNTPRTDWRSKIEWREDTGAERVVQWVSTTRLAHEIDDSWRVAARFNYADTDDRIDPSAGARFIEGSLGFAWRPRDSTRWGLFGRYTYLYDLATKAQLGGAEYDQKSQILSLEGVYRADQHWEFAGKLARREGEARFGRGAGDWFDSATTFAAAQVRYELQSRWHALAEYRWLDVDDGGTRQGALVALERDLTRNFRVGVGYNFADFSDDLTELDYEHRGWFINFSGRY